MTVITLDWLSSPVVQGVQNNSLNFSRLGFVADTGNVVTRRLESNYLAFFVPCFLILSFSPSLSRYVYLLRVPQSVRQSSSVNTLTKYVVI